MGKHIISLLRQGAPVKLRKLIKNNAITRFFRTVPGTSHPQA